MEYKIASFNMNRFGFSSNKDLSKIAEIICEEDLDVVALQEIFSEGKGIEKLLAEFVKYELYNWDFCWASPNESADLEKITDMVSHSNRGEGYAYLWNKKRFKLLEYTRLNQQRIFQPRIINSLSNDVNTDCSFFARAPYYIRLQPLYGGYFELRLINVHIYHGSGNEIDKRKAEFDVLTRDIYPAISEARYGQNRAAYTISMGDYNLNIFTPNVQTQKHCYLTEVYSYHNGKENVHILTVQDQLTTLKKKADQYADLSESPSEDGYANNYDHFTYSPELSGFSKVSYQPIDAVQKYCDGDFSYYRKNISDHLPIVMTIEI